MVGRGRGRVFTTFSPMVTDNAAATIGLVTPAIPPAHSPEVTPFVSQLEETPFVSQLEETPFVFSSFRPGGIHFKEMTPDCGNGDGNFVQGLQSFPGVDAEATSYLYDPIEKLLHLSTSLTDEYDYEEPSSHPIPAASSVASFIQEIQLQHIKGPNDFFIKSTSRTASAWKIMQRKLNLWYSQFGENFPAPDLNNLVKGGHYVAFSEEESTWCRVVINDWKSNGTVCVQLLDDGGVRLTDINNIRHIRKIFCNLPMQAQHASIQMVDAEPWTPEENALFKSEVEGKQFFAVIIKNTMDENYAPFQTVGIALLQIGEDDTTRIYTFGERLKFGYSFGNI